MKELLEALGFKFEHELYIKEPLTRQGKPYGDYRLMWKFTISRGVEHVFSREFFTGMKEWSKETLPTTISEQTQEAVLQGYFKKPIYEFLKQQLV